MLSKLEKFDHILAKDIESEIDQIVAAGTISPSEVKVVCDAIGLMLKTKEYEDWLAGEDMGSSYRRGRSPVTGRYVSRSRGDYYEPNRMSRHDGTHIRGSYGRAYDMDMYDQDYSGHSIKDRMVAKLENMVDMAQSDYERQEVLNAIKTIESMQ